MTAAETRFGTFAWRVTASHTVAYSIAGLFALAFLDYREHFATDQAPQMNGTPEPSAAALPII
jgi:hypothetical protein